MPQVWNKPLRNEPPGETIIHRKTGPHSVCPGERCPLVGGEGRGTKGTAETVSTLHVSKGSPPGSLFNTQHIISTLWEIKQRTGHVIIYYILVAIPYQRYQWTSNMQFNHAI